MIKIGFTGTQQGMSKEQQREVELHMREEIEARKHNQIEVHHGCCIGADAQFHEICRALNLEYDCVDITVVLHPPKNPSKVDSNCYDFTNFHTCELREKSEYAQRNHNIVYAVDEMIATPKEQKEVLRSGTWATMRYTKKMKNTSLYHYTPTGTLCVH